MALHSWFEPLAAAGRLLTLVQFFNRSYATTTDECIPIAQQLSLSEL